MLWVPFAEKRAVDKIAALHRWRADEPQPLIPDFTSVLDGSFRLEAFTQHHDRAVILGPPYAREPGTRLSDILPAGAMHLIANAAQAAIGNPEGVTCQYPIQIRGQWYRTIERVSVPHGAKQVILNVQRHPLC